MSELRRHGAKGGRRPLTHVGGPVEVSGPSAPDATLAAAALDIAPDEAAARAHVHGFHSYPARLDPRTARRLVLGLSSERGVLLDPFCGSGTVLVEARLAGRRALGIDANPLAVELAWLKVRGTTEIERERLVAAAKTAAEHAESRRARKAGATHRYGPEDVALFDPHVLLELDGLRAGMGKVRDPAARRALSLVLSAILVKVSRRAGDTARAGTGTPKRLASGFTIRFFVAKTEELAKRLAAFAAMLPRGAPAPTVRLGDARALAGVPDRSVSAIVTSPPYAGTYDYLAHHAARLRWLAMDASSFAATEIGARRELAELPFRDAVARWDRDLGACLAEMARVLAPHGAAALVLADSAVGHRPLDADRVVRRLAPRAGLEVTAVASQARPHFHEPSSAAFRDRPRREHAIVLRPSPPPNPRQSPHQSVERPPRR